MRAAQLKISMAEHVSRLIKSDADAAGLSDFLADEDAQATKRPGSQPGGQP